LYFDCEANVTSGLEKIAPAAKAEVLRNDLRFILRF
jgi:hypothetical protein